MNWTAVYTCGRRGPLDHGVHTEAIEADTTADAWRKAVELSPAEDFELRYGACAAKRGSEKLTKMLPCYVKSPEARLETFGYCSDGRRVKVSVRWSIRTQCQMYNFEQERIVAGTGLPEFFNTGQVGGDGNSFEWLGRVDGPDPLADYITRKSKLKEIDHDFIKVCDWGRHHFHTQFREHSAPGPETLADMEKLIAKYSK